MGRPTAVTIIARSVRLTVIGLVIAGCGPFTMPIADSSRIVVDATVGPAAPQPIHGLFMTARLSTAGGIEVQSWDPTVRPTGISVIPGDDRVAVWIAPAANTTLCIDGPDPATSGCFSGAGTIARCDVEITVPPAAIVTLDYVAIDRTRCRLEVVSVAT